MANPTDSTSYSQAIADPLANGWETMADTDTDLAIELLGGEASTPTSRNADREIATVDGPSEHQRRAARILFGLDAPASRPGDDTEATA